MHNLHTQPAIYQYSDQEPLSTRPMQVAPGGSRNFKGMAIVDGEREWSNNVFDCLADPLTFVVSWFVPCLVYGRNRARYQALETYVSPKPHQTLPLQILTPSQGRYCIASCFGCNACVGMTGRGKTRARYGIAGSGCSDCMLSCCCIPCTLTQESREIEQEEQSLAHPGAGFSMFTRS
ncbi:PLAC8-domain-containing protein [Mycena crocata]|nr:PLAC8-domain-containing protein [Mycena crocata]